ncbi:MAG TPA: hypothetical protein VKJ01_13515, partial [Candidatus Solibacter sp.]|nr:hypothetical protein [Candidatus Solibacter sp.]
AARGEKLAQPAALPGPVTLPGPVAALPEPVGAMPGGVAAMPEPVEPAYAAAFVDFCQMLLNSNEFVYRN